MSALLARFYIYRFLVWFYLWLPISVLYMQEMRGLSLTQITAMGAVAWVACAAMEVPTGAVADVWGRRYSLALGAGLFGLALLGTGHGTTLWVLAAFGVLQTTAFTFISGADMAWLYDALKAEGREEEFVRHQGRALAVMYAAQGLGAVLGSLLGLLGLNLPYLVAGVLALAAAGVALRMPEPPVERRPGSARPTLWGTLSGALQLARSDREVRFTILYAAVTYLAPFLLFYILFQPYARSIGLPNGWIGAAMVLLRAISLAGAQWAGAVSRRVGELPLLWLAPLVVVSATLGMAVSPGWWSMALLAGLMFVNAIHRPVISALLNRQVSSDIRATVLSTVSLLSVLLVAGVEPVMGFVADRWGIPAMLLTLGAASGAGVGALLTLWRPRVRREAEPIPALR